MDRKIKQKTNHHDKPSHQRWLYQLADRGMFRAIFLIWGICWLTIGLSVVIVKALIKFTK